MRPTSRPQWPVRLAHPTYWPALTARMAGARPYPGALRIRPLWTDVT